MTETSRRPDKQSYSLSESLAGEVRGFWRATLGFPDRLSGNFGRMLYLSAATITTLGFGDIVPMSDAARFWVGTEAVVGIVVAGAFLNSLFGH